MSEIRLLLVDDHPVVRAGIRAALQVDPSLLIVGEAVDGDAGVEMSERLHPQVVLMDLRLTGDIDGAQATARIRRLPEAPRVLILTTYDRESDILPAIAAGATGYLLKDAAPDDLVRAVHDTAAGRTVLAPSVATRLVERARTPDTSLTAREAQILTMVADGLSNQAIARALAITEATVKSHLVQVFDKLNVDSRTSAVAEARRRGAIS